MENSLKEIVNNLSHKYKADLFLFNGEISVGSADEFIRKVKTIKKKNDNFILVLTTFGGDPHSAYRMVRYIKRNYKKFILYNFGYCKSAGTMLSLGADEIVMSDFSEFGPLDIQVIKEDELIFMSGLSYYDGLMALSSQAITIFDEHFSGLKVKSGGSITTKTAAEIATQLSVGLIAPITSQIDALKLGEIQRSINIAQHYANRICEKTETINILVSHYPSHGFVIDIEEMKEIFDNVREVDDSEAKLEVELKQLGRFPQEDPIIINLKGDKLEEREGENESSSKENGKRPQASTIGKSGNEQSSVKNTPDSKAGNGKVAESCSKERSS